MTDELRLVAPFANYSGFAAGGRALLATALRAGYRVRAVEAELNLVRALGSDGVVRSREVPRFRRELSPVQGAEVAEARRTEVAPDAPTIILSNPSGMLSWHEYSQGARIGLTMLETDHLSPLWARSARNADLLLAPSHFCLDTFRRDLPDVCSHLMPLPVDDRLWSADGPKADIKGAPPFLFVSVFSTCERKHWRTLIQALAEEFRGEDVGLMCHCTRAREVEELAEWAAALGVWIGAEDMSRTDARMAEFYRAGDVFVLPSCEGYGMPFLEAGLCGLPSIALNQGGAADLVSDTPGGNGWLVPSYWEPAVGLLPQVYRSDQQWSTCNVPDLRTTLRRAYEEMRQPPLAAQKRDAAMRYARLASREQMARRLRDVVDMGCEAWGEKRRTAWPAQPTEAAPPLTVIITTHDNLESTKRTVASLRAFTRVAQQGDLWIILADDGSTDGTQEWAIGAGLSVVRCDTGGNVSRNRQMALDRYVPFDTDGFVAFLDNDVEVTPGWWETMAPIFERYPRVGILAPCKVYGHGGNHRRLDFDGKPLAGQVQNIGNRFHSHGGTYPCKVDRPLLYVDYVESACMVGRSQVWEQVEWDSQFPIWYEDADVCFQARAKGWEVCATGDVRVVHHAHSTAIGEGRAAETEERRKAFMRKWRSEL